MPGTLMADIATFQLIIYGNNFQEALAEKRQGEPDVVIGSAETRMNLRSWCVLF